MFQILALPLALSVLVNTAWASEWTNSVERNPAKAIVEALVEHPEVLVELVDSYNLTRAARMVPFGHELRNFKEDGRDKCKICKRLVQVLKIGATFIPDFDTVENATVKLCKAIVQRTSPDTNEDILCPGTMALYGPHVLSILKSLRATADKLCRNFNFCHGHEITTKSSFTNSALKSPRKQRSIKRNTNRKDLIKIAHLTDIHVDPDYAIGSPNDCGLPACCREEYPGTGSAGVFGALGCNVPQRTVEHFMNRTKELNPDFVIYTGDNPPHHPWEETVHIQMECTNIVMESILNTLGDYHVYPGIGNHESYPTNLYYLKNEGVKELQRRIPEWWAPIAKFGEEQLETASEAAYYSTVTPIEGLRIISVNTQFWYVLNFYNALNEGTRELNRMLVFIEDTLKAARLNEEKVIMMLHHPPGEKEVISMYSQWYQDLILEFSDVIVLQVAGHTHQDHFKLFINPADGKAKSSLFVAPSITSRSGSGDVNPSMRIYYLDPVTLELVDYDQYRMYLSTSTEVMPDIEFVYSFKKEYSMTDMSPTSMLDFVNRLKTDDRLFEQWWTNYESDSGRNEQCDEACKLEQVCLITNPSIEEAEACIDAGSL